MNNNLVKRIKRGMAAKHIASAIVAHGTRQFTALDGAVERIAANAAASVRKRIQAGQVVPPNNDEYAAWKARNSLSPNPLEATGEYVNSIGHTKVGPCLYYVGPPKDGTHSSGLPFSMLANILEFGTEDGIPARPHLAPARREAAEKVNRMVRLNSRSRRKS